MRLFGGFIVNRIHLWPCLCRDPGRALESSPELLTGCDNYRKIPKSTKN